MTKFFFHHSAEYSIGGTPFTSDDHAGLKEDCQSWHMLGVEGFQDELTVKGKIVLAIAGVWLVVGGFIWMIA